jgi:hypothetical protein
VIAREGMTCIGDKGQTRAHPLLQVERDARSAFHAGMRTLKLEL